MGPRLALWPGPLEALSDRGFATPAVFSFLPGAETASDDTPFRIASEQHPVRVTRLEMTDALINPVVTTAQDRGRQGILLCAVNQIEQPPDWLPRLTAAVDTVTYLGLLSSSALHDIDGVQTQQLDGRDPLRDETVIAVLSEDFSTALCIKPDGRHDSSRQSSTPTTGRFVQTIVRNMMRQFNTW